MTEYEPTMITPDSILEKAVDSREPVNYNPSESDVLLTVMNQPIELSEFDAIVKSTQIMQPEEMPVKETKATENSESLANGKLFESIVSPISNFINNISNLTNNYLGQNSEIVKNSEKITTESITDLIDQNQSSYSELLNSTVRETSNILSSSNDVTREINNTVSVTKESAKQNLEKINNAINSSIATSSSVLEKLTNSKESADSKESNVMTSTESTLFSLLKRSEQQEANEKAQAIDQSSNNVNNVSVKSNKLVESSEVKNILTPDKTLEKSVSVLSRTLPEAVNNLSTSVTSIAPTSTTSNSNIVEGAKIDQSTSTIINQAAPQTKVTSSPEDAKKPEDSQAQTNEYYLQAIYSALMSGKIRVKLETY